MRATTMHPHTPAVTPRRGSIAVAAILLLAVAGAAAGGPPPQAASAPVKLSRDWKRLTTPDLTIVGNASDAELRRAARVIDDFRDAIAGLLPGLKMTSPVPTELVVFRDQESFARFRPRDERGRRRDSVAGYFTTGPHVNHMVLGAYGDRRYTYQVILHEYTHFIVSQNFHEVLGWLSEGIAEFFSTFQSDYEDGRSLVGAPPAGRLADLHSMPMAPLRQLMTNEGAATLRRSGMGTAVFYAQSWALVHYLQVGNNRKRAGQIGAYLRALGNGLPVDRAFTASFGTTFEGLQRELEEHVSRTRLPALLLPKRRTATEATRDPAPMPEAEAAFVQGTLLLQVGATKDAEEALSKTLALNPAHVDARVALARVRGQQDRTDEGIRALEGIVAAGPGHFPAQLALAELLLRADRHEDAVKAFERAVAIAPESTAAWFGLSQAALGAGRDSQSEEALARAVQRDSNPEWYRSRVYAAFALGRDEAVVRAAKAFIDAVGWGSESAPYTAYASALASMRLGRQADAAALLRQVSDVVPLASWQDLVAQFLAGQIRADQLLAKAKGDGERTEARAYAGMRDAMAGRRDEALPHLRWVKEHGLKNYIEYGMATATLKRLEEAAKPAVP